MENSAALELSLVIPVFNEEESLRPLYDEITSALRDRDGYEVIFIDDGSTDKSLEVLQSLREGDERVRIIKFRRNFGQTAAMAAGFEHCRGRVVVPLDADGQNDPADIPKLVDKLDEGYDIVSGWRKDRQDKWLSRVLPSRVANWMISKITGVSLHDYGCTMKAYRWDSIKEIRLYGEMHRFIPALASWGGERVEEMVVNHRPRTTGVAKYGLNRTFKVVLDLITVKFLASFSTKPIYVFGGIGGLSGVAAMLSFFTVLWQKFISPDHLSMNRNPLLLLTAMLIITSFQFLLMGLLAEILVRTYHESQGRRIYTIEKIMG
ncbi:Undecaprenyl-phosphate 4-deoxy-4-formamido-L-arabinose transferase [Anaerohalosphaera lusitana]|uniref:Undecaprenyl-phosphate 4-deoxy-4-formamido-L-arabinose transferase n=1 Tax=Anaerohalosphaera lusitana TaxID=1936003 RepID=A0A1U9NNV5_9BACT|nr:glycosyltransferase family 2 protein [Anaerohalosphaera lusitana]AQT69632.1 Undecaprenyl-phosphate 4-deoxy-4-formamido-L-arabinose transferase [Anaerohalosphaera lusitana]